MQNSNECPFADTLSSISRNASRKVALPARMSRLPCRRFSGPNPSSSVMSERWKRWGISEHGLGAAADRRMCGREHDGPVLVDERCMHIIHRRCATHAAGTSRTLRRPPCTMRPSDKESKEAYSQSLESRVVIVPSLHEARTSQHPWPIESRAGRAGRWTDQSERTTNFLSLWIGGYGSVLSGAGSAVVAIVSRSNVWMPFSRGGCGPSSGLRRAFYRGCCLREYCRGVRLGARSLRT